MDYFEEDFNVENFENYLEKDKSLAKKRYHDVTKAIRKRNIAHSYSLFAFSGWYDNLHQYSKNKIHCSCPMCSVKTNTSIYKSKGPVCGGRGLRMPMTNKRYGKKNYCISDRKQIDKLNSDID